MVVAVISVLAIAGATVGVAVATSGSKHTADPTPHPTASLTSPTSTSSSTSRSATTSTSTSSPSTSPAQFAAKLCNFLSWHDLHYPATAGPDRPTKSGPQQGWSQVCLWQSLQFNAGYHLPPSPHCNGTKTTSAAGALNCAAKDADMLALIFANSHNVNVLIGWQPGHRTVKYRYEYSAGDRKVTVDDKSIDSTCIQHLHWADGVLQVEVQDGTKAFGTPCGQAKKFVALLLRREPR